MREDELTLFVLLVFDENLNYIANLDVGIVAEFIDGDDTVAFVADVNHRFALVEGDDGTFDYLFVFNGVKRLIVGLGEFFAALATVVFAVFVGVPIEIFDWRIL